jgi:hypothetical protein
VARVGALAVVAALLTFGTASVGASSGVVGYDGSIPFACDLQELGTGTDFKEPNADPFCVEYDKTHQNVTELGVVQFLSQEPARFAAAGPKCWYFQRDHWVGSVVQGDGTTQTYKWDGDYFFDKARGLGGVHIENFQVNGQTGDPRTLPGFPDDWKPYFGPGEGGVMTTDTVRLDPRCVARAQSAPPPGPYRCSEQRGKVGSGIGPLRLDASREEIEKVLGPPARTTGRVARWCTADGGKLSAGFAGGRLRFALTTSPGFSVAGFAPGNRSAVVRRRFAKVAQRGGVGVFVVPSRARLVLLGVDRKRVRFIALLPRGTSKSATRAWLDAAR